MNGKFKNALAAGIASITSGAGKIPPRIYRNVIL
jgi:hypothetical protein